MTTDSRHIAEFLSGIMDGPVWRDDGVLKLYLYCLSRASHNQFKWRGLLLQPGDLPLSERHVASDLAWSRSKLDRKLEQLGKSGLVSITAFPQRGTLIRILNWPQYDSNQESGITAIPAEVQNKTSSGVASIQCRHQNETSQPPATKIFPPVWSHNKASVNETGFIMRPNPYKEDITTSSDEPEGFSDIWRVYPPKRRNDRDAAAALVSKALSEGVTIQDILSALEADMNSYDWIKEDGKFIPGIVKWLKKEAWHTTTQKSVTEVSKEDDEKWASR